MNRLNPRAPVPIETRQSVDSGVLPSLPLHTEVVLQSRDLPVRLNENSGHTDVPSSQPVAIVEPLPQDMHQIVPLPRRYYHRPSGRSDATGRKRRLRMNLQLAVDIPAHYSVIAQNDPGHV